MDIKHTVSYLPLHQLLPGHCPSLLSLPPPPSPHIESRPLCQLLKRGACLGVQSTFQP